MPCVSDVRTYFAVDFIAALPLDVMFNRQLRFLALVKVIRLLRARKLLQSSARAQSSNVLRVVLTLATWLLIAHWAACVFYALGYYSVCRFKWYETSWILVYWQEEISAESFCSDASSRKIGGGVRGGGEVPAGTRYVRSLYWALATMSSLGYGLSPVAYTDAEFVWAIICQVTGACIYAAIFGNIAQLIAKLAGSASRYQVQLDKVNEFIRFHKLPLSLRDKLHAYNDFLFAVHHGHDVNQIASALPPTLQREVYLHLYEHLVRRVPMFENCEYGFIEELVQLLKPQVVLKGDCVFRAFEAGNMMYFIQNGAIEIVDPTLTYVYSTLIEGAYFGELGMLTSQRRTATARALTDCILFYVTITDFEEVVKAYPKHYSEILDKALKRLENTLQTNAEGVKDAAAEVLQEANEQKEKLVRDSIVHQKRQSALLTPGLGREVLLARASSAESVKRGDSPESLLSLSGDVHRASSATSLRESCSHGGSMGGTAYKTRRFPALSTCRSSEGYNEDHDDEEEGSECNATSNGENDGAEREGGDRSPTESLPSGSSSGSAISDPSPVPPATESASADQGSHGVGAGRPPSGAGLSDTSPSSSVLTQAEEATSSSSSSPPHTMPQEPLQIESASASTSSGESDTAHRRRRLQHNVPSTSTPVQLTTASPTTTSSVDTTIPLDVRLSAALPVSARSSLGGSTVPRSSQARCSIIDSIRRESVSIDYSNRSAGAPRRGRRGSAPEMSSCRHAREDDYVQKRLSRAYVSKEAYEAVKAEIADELLQEQAAWHERAAADAEGRQDLEKELGRSDLNYAESARRRYALRQINPAHGDAAPQATTSKSAAASASTTASSGAHASAGAASHGASVISTHALPAPEQQEMTQPALKLLEAMAAQLSALHQKVDALEQSKSSEHPLPPP